MSNLVTWLGLVLGIALGHLAEFVLGSWAVPLLIVLVLYLFHLRRKTA